MQWCRVVCVVHNGTLHECGRLQEVELSAEVYSICGTGIGDNGVGQWFVGGCTDEVNGMMGRQRLYEAGPFFGRELLGKPNR